MNVNCQWLEKNLEAFFCDGLSAEENRLVKSHLDGCAHCSEKVEELRAIDPLMRRFVQHEFAIAQRPRQRRSPLLLGGFATAVAAAIILIAIAMFPRHNASTLPQQATNPTIGAPATNPDAPSVPKANDSSAVDRAKPDGTPDRPVPPASSATLPNTQPAPNFLVTDIAGYSKSLADFRDHVLIFGVWSADQAQSVTNLERIYKTFGSNTTLRILGVANQREPKPKTATFPIAYNQGSLLLGAKPGEFVVVDSKGEVKLRGSLLDSPETVLNSVRTVLGQLNVR